MFMKYSYILYFNFFQFGALSNFLENLFRLQMA